jgi:hypothetical protein
MNTPLHAVTPHAITLLIGATIGTVIMFLIIVLCKSYEAFALYATFTAATLAVGSTLLAVIIGAAIVVFSTSYLIKVSRQD